MIGALIIVFREMIEAGLIIGIVLAATRGSSGSRMWITGGTLAGIAGACLVAVFMGVIGGALGGFGQEYFNVAVLLVAVAMLAWHNIWMAGHGRAMAGELFDAGRRTVMGKNSPLALAVVVGAAVMREGSEVALFLYGVAASGKESFGAMATGGILGIILGAAVSSLTYAGLLRIPQSRIFGVTSLLIAFLAAGMAAQAMSFLQQAGAVEFLSGTAWSSSWLIRESSIVGRILHTLVGYDDRPTWLQLLVYVATLLSILLFTRMARQPGQAPRALPSGSAAE